MEYRERLTYLLKEVGEASLKDRSGMREEFRALCLAGLPDNSSLRPPTYRTLLNLSPPAILVSQYSTFVEELEKRVTELPLPSISTSASEELTQDKLLKEIERDVIRTFGDLAWFSGEEMGLDRNESAYWKRLRMLEEVEEQRARNLADLTPALNSEPTPSLTLLPPTPTTPTFSKSSPFPSSQSAFSTTHSTFLTRRQALLRPLFIYASLNPGISYVQGMNSIVAVFYWIFSTSNSSNSSTTSSLEAEASTFFALGAILSQIRDLFVKSLDGTVIPSSPRKGSTISIPSLTVTGLGATLSRFSSLLQWLDPNIAMSLENKQVEPSLYMIRWLTTLFANDFALPDLVRIWDRIISFYPSESDSDTQESLSPVLGHLLDLSLAILLMLKQPITSPYSSFSKVISTLQSPQIEGAAVDTLLSSAYDIRERRLGKINRPSSISSVTSTGGGDWRSRLNSAITATATGPTASSLKDRWFAATSNSPLVEKKDDRRLSLANEFDIDDSVSQADSDTSNSTIPLMFASRGQTISNGNNNIFRRISMENGLEQVEGKTLPPPPEVLESREKYQAMNLPLPPSIDEGDEDQFSSEDEEFGAAFRARLGSWGGWRNSIARISASDTAASISKTTTNLSLAASLSAASISQSASQISSSDTVAAISKATTNLTIQASLLRDRVTEETPERLARIKENVSAVSGRLYASTESEHGSGSGIRRPGSPVSSSFTPPRWNDSPSMSRRPISPPQAFSTIDNFSNGPKPLLLSGGAARRTSSSDGTETLSPPTSKRNSISWRSPSPTGFKELQYSSQPTSHPNFPEPSPLNLNSNARISASAFRSPSTAPTSLGLESLGLDSNLQVDGIRKVLPRRKEIEEELEDSRSSSNSSIAAVPSADGRGWSLSDIPQSSRPTPAPLEISYNSLTKESPPLPRTYDSPVSLPSKSNSPSTIEETKVLRPKSIHIDDIIIESNSPIDIPSRHSSTSSDLPHRSKVIRKAPARKRTSKQDVTTPTSSHSVEGSNSRVNSVTENEEEEFSIREVKGGENEVEDILSAYE